MAKKKKYLKYVRYLFLWCVIFTLVYFISQPLITLQRVNLPHKQNILNKEQVSFDEMNSFLEVWSQYCAKGYPEIIGSGVSIYNEAIEEAVPQNIYIWLKRRDWTVKRFYYVEERMRSIVKAAILTQHMENNRLMLRHPGGLNSEALKNLKSIVDEQEEKFSIREVSKEEVEMVRGNLSLVDDILNCKVFYKP